MGKRVVVGIDLDDVCYEFVIPLLDKYNLRYDDWVSYGDITDWNIHQFLKPECKDIFSEFATEGFFEELFIPASTVGWLSTLNEIADIKFVTAGSSRTIPWREALLKRELDFFNDNMLVKLSDKWLLNMDYFVDDNPKMCEMMSINSPHTTIFQIARPWNDNKGCDIHGAMAAITKDIRRRCEYNRQG